MQIMPMTSEKMRSDFRNYSFTNFLVIIALGKNKYLRHKYPKSKRKKGRNVIIFCSMLPTNPCPFKLFATDPFILLRDDGLSDLTALALLKKKQDWLSFPFPGVLKQVFVENSSLTYKTFVPEPVVHYCFPVLSVTVRYFGIIYKIGQVRYIFISVVFFGKKA